MKPGVPTVAKIVALHLAIQLSTATVVLAYVTKQVEQSFIAQARNYNEALLAGAASLIGTRPSGNPQAVVKALDAAIAGHGHRLRIVERSSRISVISDGPFLPPRQVRSHVTIPSGVVLEAWDDMRETRRLSGVIALAFSGAVLLGIEAGILLAFLLFRSFRRRVLLIADIADQVGKGDLSRRLEVSAGGSPFDRLGQVLNGMFSQLERLMAELRAITDAVAHDVRSPLMRMRVHAEKALSTDHMGEARPLIGRVLREADAALRVTSTALEISRAETAVDRSEFEEINLGELAEDVVAAYEPVAESRCIALIVDVDPDAMVIGHRQLIGQAVTNLLDNTLKYAAAGKECFVCVDRTGGFVRIMVADRGPGIAPEDRRRASGRFVKLSASRSEGSAGLGLALVDAVVRVHGGEMLLEDNDPGLRVVIAIPATSSPFKYAEPSAPSTATRS